MVLGMGSNVALYGVKVVYSNLDSTQNVGYHPSLHMAKGRWRMVSARTMHLLSDLLNFSLCTKSHTKGLALGRLGGQCMCEAVSGKEGAGWGARAHIFAPRPSWDNT